MSSPPRRTRRCAARAAAIILTNDEELAKKINNAVFPGTQGGPLEHVIAARRSASARRCKPEFKAYQQQVVKNARVLADALEAGRFDLSPAARTTT